MDHNYLLLAVEEIDRNSYPIRMLEGNIIYSLLKSRIQAVDEEYMIYYDITSKQQMSSFYEKKKIGLADLKMILGSFVYAAEEMAEYLMDAGNLLIQPEYIYQDIEKKKLFFCYYPGEGKDIREQLQILLEYILPKIEHKEEKAVVLGYGVYREVLDDNFQLENIKKVLYQVLEAKDQAESTKQIDAIENEVKDQNYSESTGAKLTKEGVLENNADIWMSEPESKREKYSFGFILMGIGLAVGGFVGIALLKMLGYLSWFETEWVLAVCICFILGGMLLWLIQKRYRLYMQKKRESEDVHEECFEKEEKKNPMENKENLINENTLQGAPNIHEEGYGETMILSLNTLEGPATLISREPGELATIYLEDEITIIGKLPVAADVVIDLPTVSRMHAKIKRTGEDYILSDLNSRNGTSVNGQMLKTGEEHILRDQDEVDFAQARYVFIH